MGTKTTGFFHRQEVISFVKSDNSASAGRFLNKQSLKQGDNSIIKQNIIKINDSKKHLEEVMRTVQKDQGELHEGLFFEEAL